MLVLAIVSEPVPWRRRVGHLAVLGVALLFVLPWAYRNVDLYGDPMAIGAMSHAVPSMIVERSVFDRDLYTTLPRELFKSFVGVFGYGLPLRKWVYAVYLACMAFAGIGLIKGPVAEGRRRGLSRPRTAGAAHPGAAIGVLNYLVVMRINWQFVQPQGRYMFPALPAIVVALALGLEQWPLLASSSATRRVSSRLVRAQAANTVILLVVVMPAGPTRPTWKRLTGVVTPVASDGAPAYARVCVWTLRFVIFVLSRGAPPSLA